MVHMKRVVLIALVLGVVLVCCGCARIRPPRGVAHVERTLVTTGYCKCGKCCGWKRNWFGRPVYKYGSLKGKRKKVGETASGRMARRGTIAADTGLYPFGTVVYIEGYGYGRVEDRGGAIKGNHIDLYFNSHSRAIEWGRQTKRVKVWMQ